MKFYHVQFEAYELLVDDKTTTIINSKDNNVEYKNVGIYLLYIPRELIYATFFGPYLLKNEIFQEISNNGLSGLECQEICRIKYISTEKLSVSEKNEYKNLIIGTVLGTAFVDDFGLFENNLFLSFKALKILLSRMSIKGTNVLQTEANDYIREYGEKLEISNYSYRLPYLELSTI